EGAEDLLALTVLPSALARLDRELAAGAGDLRVGVLVVAQAEDPVDARADRLVAVLGIVDRDADGEGVTPVEDGPVVDVLRDLGRGVAGGDLPRGQAAEALRVGGAQDHGERAALRVGVGDGR